MKWNKYFLKFDLFWCKTYQEQLSVFKNPVCNASKKSSNDMLRSKRVGERNAKTNALHFSSI